MEVKTWLEKALDQSSLSEDGRDYLWGRGADDATIKEWGIVNFVCPLDPCPDENLHRAYGPHFERFEDKAIYPLTTPSGSLLGFDSITVGEKDHVRFLLPESKWNPVWIGIQRGMPQIYEGSDLIVVEGRFDVFALYHIAPDKAVLGSGPAHLSRHQYEFLKRWAKGDVIMAYDNDAPGRKGTAESLKRLRSCGVKCREASYGNPGEDPGSIWDRGGIKALQQAFQAL
jgi:DNA primase